MIPLGGAETSRDRIVFVLFTPPRVFLRCKIQEQGKFSLTQLFIDAVNCFVFHNNYMFRLIVKLFCRKIEADVTEI